MKRLYILRLRFKYFFERILIFKKKKRMSKVIIGKTYKVKETPQGKAHSNGPGTRVGDGSIKVTITRKLSGDGHGQMYQGTLQNVSEVLLSKGYAVGGTYNFYEHELEVGPYNKETILEEIEEVNKKKVELDNETSELQSKIDWMDEVGVTEFDEDEYKVWKTLTLLEDDSVGKLTKMKEIANLIKG